MERIKYFVTVLQLLLIDDYKAWKGQNLQRGSHFIFKLIFKVAWVMIPLNFDQLVYHNKQSNNQSIITAVLEKG